MSSRTITRKRSRAQFDDEDELASAVEQTPLSNAKRKKANLAGPPPGDNTMFGSIKKRVGDFLNYKEQGKENDSAEEDEDELADEEVSTPGRKKTVKDIFDVPSSPDEERRILERSGSGRSKVTLSAKKTYSSKGKTSASNERTSTALNEPTADIFDLPDEDSIPRLGRKPGTSVEKTKALAGSTEGILDPPKRKRGRPRKSEILKQAKQLSNKATREKMMADKQKEIGEEDDTATPIGNDGRRAKKGESPPVSVSESKAGSTARKRGRPARQELTVPGSAKELKSVLTPSKKKRGRPRKSVAFEEVDELDLGFKDIPDSASAKKHSKSKLISSREIVQHSGEPRLSESPEEMDQEVQLDDESGSADDDDVACTLCSKLHSKDSNPMLLCDGCGNGSHMKCAKLKEVPEGTWFCLECFPTPDEILCGICSSAKHTKKNPFILCENCDNGIHLDCSDMAEVPKGEWFCQDCMPEPENSLSKSVDEDDSISNKFPNIEGFEDHLRCMQRTLLDKLTGHKRIKLMGHDDEMQKVYQVVQQTIVAGEGNSMLVIGARGCGKTTLVETVISDLSPNHRENFHVVRLNGFIHTDDKLALKEIWRQLGREMEVEDEINGKSNYSDTLASLLALLSHPSEMADTQSNQTAKSVVFILDEFDLFTTHSRQTLLYNLFDIAQARKAPIVVLGLTTRVDVVESLEKRVKSRFSHRYVHLSLPRSLPAFWEICREGLLAELDEIDGDGLVTSAASRGEFMAFWQNMVEDLYKKDEKFKRHIQSQFYRSKSVPVFFTSCILPVANISPTKFPLTGKDFLSSQSLAAPDSKLQLLQGLSELELALLIAAARLDIIQDTDTCNFAMAYDEYSSLTSRHKIQTSSTGVSALGASAKVWGRDVALGAWERLADYDLLVHAGVGGGAARDFSAGGRMWKVDVGLEEITGSVDSLSTIMTKWCREI